MSGDFRLAIPAVAAWVTAALAVGVDAVIPAVALWAVAGLATVAALSRRGFAIVALSAAAAAVVATAVAVEAPHRQPPALVELAHTGRTVPVLATVSGRADGRSTPAILDEVDGMPVRVPALLFGEPIPAEIGASVQLTGTLGGSDPGDEVSFLVFAESSPVVRAPPPWYLDWANQLRQRFRLEATGLPGSGGELLPGLAIGDTSAVSDQLDAAMKSSSLSHLTAVSGANCAIVIGLMLAAGSAAGVPRWARIAASTAVLVAFVVLVTPEPSVLRAAVMAVLVLVSLYGGRPVRGLPVLALATLTLVVVDPWLSRSYGFILSVLATAGLLLLTRPLAHALERWVPTWLATVIAVPLAAQLACQPVIVLLNAALPTYGILANLLAAPAAPIATVIGLAACVLLVVVPPLGHVLCQLAWLPSAWIAGVALFFESLPLAQVPWPPGPLGVVLLAAASALIVIAATGRRWAIAGLLVVSVAYVGGVGGPRVTELLGRPAGWQIAACDVGQGDAVVVRSRDQIALIDTGPEPARLTACLRELGVDRVNLLVLTHYDLDHVGGASAVLGRADRVFVGPSSDASDDLLRADFAEHGAVVEQVSRAPTGLLGDLRWVVLWPPQRLNGIEPGNPASVTVEFEGVGECPDGCLSSIFLGDLGEDAQNRLLATAPLGSVDVVKVAHHGSADQSEALYQRLRAVVGVIGVGVDNGYGHPTDELLSILARAGTVPARTDRSGLILLAPGDEPGTVRVWTDR